ncbi:M48 family metallopeptidase [Dactylosporangium sp. NBC_01737]|uniref:M48 family metallopeptidase n=1 Tax=Dactylosporangium sp. NBC_01737 TaxID=2975959 RepID=UPI002E0E38CD|nr:M48 family metallopeptidase [Dactylosporangium sp. NBC_01737]
MSGLQGAIKAYHKNYSERLIRSGQLAETLRLGPNQLPEIYRLLPPICEAFGIEEPELFLALGPVNAFTTGATRTSITLCSGLLDHLAPDEIEAVLAHECGHILCQHMLFHSMAQFLELAVNLGSSANIPFASALLSLGSGPLRMALGNWSRKSELSADRAAAAYMGSAEAITRVMFRFAGIRHDSRYTQNVQPFADQALEYEALRESKWDRFLQWQIGQSSTHPLLAVRVREIQSWVGTPTFANLAALAASVRAAARCHSCGGRTQPGWKHCQRCGTTLIYGAPAAMAGPPGAIPGQAAPPAGSEPAWR